jgi:nitrite reductase/ring-hydroxylating ferredoxin subunit
VSTQAQLDPAVDPRTDLLAEPATEPGLRRRSVLRGACVVCVGAVGAGVLAACGGSGGGSDASGGSDGGGGDTIKTSDIPVGGGKVFDGPQVVVTQPTAGEFKAFTAVCTHQRFLVGNVQGGTINCLHHGSMYDMTTGAVVGGPAPAPLAAKTVTVSGDTLTVT